ncbi:MAG: hypothetical protein NZ519_02350 [Bacteroidia bacterium]|nr:hypothetical protein [Bacteroidia bacterium]
MKYLQVSTDDVKNFLDILFEYQISLQGLRTIHLSILLQKIIHHYKLNNVKDFFQLLKNNPDLAYNCKEMICVSQTEFFRDSSLWLQLKNHLKIYETQNQIYIFYPHISSGEELYSLLIFLHEVNLIGKVMITATEVCQNILAQAQRGSYTLKSVQNATKLYQESKISHAPLTDYFDITDNVATVKSYLKQKVSFYLQDLQTFYFADLAEYDIIWYRNQLIYWDIETGNKHLTELTEKLKKGGLLILGYIENLDRYLICNKFEALSFEDKIYRKK